MLTQLPKSLLLKSAGLLLLMVRLSEIHRIYGDPLQDRRADGTLRIGVNEVLLDVVVTDKKGRQLKDLGREEFEVFEDGALQTITSSRVAGLESNGSESPKGTSEPVASAPGVSPNTQTQRQLNLIMLVFDRINIYGRQMARDAAVQYFNDLSASDFVSVMSIDRTLRVLQAFTRDAARLNTAVRLAVDGTPQQFADVSNAVRESILQAQNSQESADAALAAAGRGGGSGTQAGASAAAAKLNQVVGDMLRQSAVGDETIQGQATVEALMNVIRGAQIYPGRKAVVFFAERVALPTSVIERFRDLISAANRANLSFYCIDTSGLNKESELESMSQELKTLARVSQVQQQRKSGAVTREEVMLSENTDNVLRMSKQNTLADLAQSTGGIFVANTNDLRPGFQKVSEDIHLYYELSYVPANTVYDGAFRRVEVKVKRPGLIVRSRQGYYAYMGRDATVSSFEIPLLNAMDAKVLPREIQFRNASLLYPTQGPGTEVVLYLEIPLADISFPLDKTKREYEARVAALISVRNSEGGVVEKFSQEFPLRGPKEQVADTQHRNLVLYRTVELTAGRYTMETAVRDSFSKKTSVKRSLLMVPKRSGGSIALSTVILVKRLDPPRPDSNLVETPLMFNRQAIVPNLNPEVDLRDWSNLAFYFVAVTGKKEPLGVVDLILSKDGKPVGHMGEKPLPSPDDKGRIPYITALPLNSLGAGQYEASVVVRQGDSTSSRAVTFSVQ